MFNSKATASDKFERTQNHTAGCNIENEASPAEVTQTSSVLNEKLAPTHQLMERICDRENLNQAYRRVVKNAGAAGIDGMNVTDMLNWLKDNRDNMVSSLLEGSYKPQPVRRVDIPKPQGGLRQLGIPTCVDRLIQQAVLQILQPIIDTQFSDSSYGFRPRRSAHNAIRQAQSLVKEGRIYVVDIDLENFFNRVNHDILMSRLSRYIEDQRVLRLIRKFLNAGIMDNGVIVRSKEGTPQGGPLSPLLANVILDDLDKELEKRGHKFARYADDCNIYVHSEAAAKRTFVSVSKWLSNNLRLRVNQEKSAASLVGERKFLGYTITCDGEIMIAKKSIERFRKKIIDATKRRTPKNLEENIRDLTPFLRGWLQYFRLAEKWVPFQSLDSWIRQRLRSIRIRQCKNAGTLLRFLVNGGVRRDKAAKIALSGKGAWRLAHSLQAQQTMSNKWFKDLGLYSLDTAWKASKS